MWKELRDFFSLSKKDMRGIYVLLSLLFLTLLAKIFLPFLIATKEPDFTEFDRMVLALEKAQRVSDEIKLRETKTRQPEFNRPDKEIAEIKLNPFPFDPNAMSEESWLKLGLNIRQVRNIQNFLARGGRFRGKEDFKRIYTISNEEYEILMPFIAIAGEAPGKKTDKDEHESSQKESSLSENIAFQLIDINKADSLELLQVKGIGPSFARRIIRYRDMLGGFHSANQLLEVYGLDSARFNQISGCFAFSQEALCQIDINTVEVKDLAAHPYIDFYLAKSIIDQRIKKGKLISDDDLYGIPMMHDALFQKVIPYFKFN